MTSESHTAHTIAGNFQGIYSKHHDSGAEILNTGWHFYWVYHHNFGHFV